ncbi:hypothetical protein HY605_00060 [Candidatus Peregrinibacteria bacterium]|nr:hypothetical protein [Candidatus Peregrinibacteria bacterium]
MMQFYNSDYGLATGWHFHMLFGTVLFVGVVFLFIWAIKSFDKKQLKKWTTWLLVIGILGTLLTGQLGFRGWKNMMDWDGKDKNPMQELFDNEDEDGDEAESETEDSSEESTSEEVAQ